MSTPAIVGLLVAAWLAILTYAIPGAPARRPRRHHGPVIPADVEARPDEGDVYAVRYRARRLAQTGRYEAMLAERLLIQTGPPVPDPGNPGHTLRLADDPHRAITRGRVLLAVNPANSELLALPVHPAAADPLAAAAWTYDDPDSPVPVTAATYAALARRT
jgi:hypothetical protein